MRTAVLRIGLPALVLALAVVVSSGSARSAAVRPCHAVVQRGVLPSWARTGFSDSRPKLPHSLSRGGGLAALIFGDPLLAPPSKHRSNKILWVARAPLTPGGGDLRLHARRMRGIRAVGRAVWRVVAAGRARRSSI